MGCWIRGVGERTLWILLSDYLSFVLLLSREKEGGDEKAGTRIGRLWDFDSDFMLAALGGV